MGIILAILVFCIIIIIHEIGHFATAKLFRMRVYEFAIGLGPIIFSRKKNGTVYAVKAIPFGGSVQLGEDGYTDEGDNDTVGTNSADNENVIVASPSNDDTSLFVNKPLWQRTIVIAAGAFMNLVLGFIVCVIIAATSQYIVTTTVVSFRDGVTENGIAATQGKVESRFRANDKIVSINGMRVFTDTDIWYKLANTNAAVDPDGYANFDFVVKRDNQLVALDSVKWKARTENGHTVFLPDFYVGVARKTFGNVVASGFYSTVSYSRIVWLTLMDLARGTYGLNDLSGPVGTVSIMDQSTVTADGGRDYSQLLPLAAFMTINVGIFNLLPIPALDGGRLFFFIIEAVRRKPINPRYENAIHFAGFALLLMFMVVITFKDVGSIFVK